MRPHNTVDVRLHVWGLIALAADRWFDSSVLAMEPEEESDFCEDLWKTQTTVRMGRSGA